MNFVIDQVVPGSAAESAGLKGIDYRKRLLGDVIVAADGNPIAKMDDFIESLRNKQIGDPIKLKVRRGEELYDMVVTVMDIS